MSHLSKYSREVIYFQNLGDIYSDRPVSDISDTGLSEETEANKTIEHYLHDPSEDGSL